MRNTRISALLLVLFAATGLAQSAADQAFAHAVQLHQSGDLEGAVREYQAVVAANPGRFDARSNLGAVFAKLGRYQEAIVQYQEARKSAPAQVQDRLRLNIALAYYKSNQIAQAASELIALHGDQPGDLNTTMLLADCRLRMGEYKDVISLLTPVEADQPGNRAITYMLGMALIRDGQVAEGQRRVDLILRDGESAEGRFLLGVGMLGAGDYPGAVKAFQSAIASNPHVPSLQSFYGQALLQTGDADGAAAAFGKELAENPNDFDANLRLGQILAHRGERDQARPLLERALQLRPASLEARATLEGKDAAPKPADGVPVGALAPETGPLGLARFRGRQPVVLVFGSYTCPQFRGSADAIKTLHAKYKDRVAFELVYIKEAHAAGQWQSTINEREHIDMQPAKDLPEKQAHASACIRRLDLKFPAVVDGMDGKAEAAYQAWPSRLYLVGRDGKVVFNSRLGELNFQPARLDAAIMEALKK